MLWRMSFELSSPSIRSWSCSGLSAELAAPTPCTPCAGLGDGAGACQPARGRGGVQGGLRRGRPLHRLAVVRPARRLR